MVLVLKCQETCILTVHCHDTIYTHSERLHLTHTSFHYDFTCNTNTRSQVKKTKRPFLGWLFLAVKKKYMVFYTDIFFLSCCCAACMVLLMSSSSLLSCRYVVVRGLSLHLVYGHMNLLSVSDSNFISHSLPRLSTFLFAYIKRFKGI